MSLTVLLTFLLAYFSGGEYCCCCCRWNCLCCPAASSSPSCCSFSSSSCRRWCRLGLNFPLFLALSEIGGEFDLTPDAAAAAAAAGKKSRCCCPGQVHWDGVDKKKTRSSRRTNNCWGRRSQRNWKEREKKVQVNQIKSHLLHGFFGWRDWELRCMKESRSWRSGNCFTCANRIWKPFRIFIRRNKNYPLGKAGKIMLTFSLTDRLECWKVHWSSNFKEPVLWEKMALAWTVC